MLFSVQKLVSAGLCAVATAVLSASAMADSLSGKVLDPQGLAVPRANIRLLDKNRGVLRNGVSQPDGSYSFEGLTAGKYFVEVSAAAEALTASRQVSVEGDRKEDLRLAISGRKIEYLVTATDGPQSVEEVAKAIDVIDSNQITLRAELSVAEAVRNLPGIRVQTLEGPGSLTTIKTRGLRTQDTAVLFDGMRFRDAASPQGDASGFLGELMILDTDRIEFLRGSGSSLYGSNALGGVLNITSKMGGGIPHGEALTEAGGLGLFRTLFSFGGGAASDRLTYSNAISTLNMFKGVRSGAPYKSMSDQGAVRYSITPEMSVTGRVWFSRHNVTSTESSTFTGAVLANSPTSGPVPAIALPIDQLELFEQGQVFNAGDATYIPGQIDPDGNRKGRFFSGGVTFEHRPTASASYRVVAQNVSTNRNYIDGPLGPGSFEPSSLAESHFNGYTTVLKAQLEQQTGRFNRVTFGYEFERERYDSFTGARYDNSLPDTVQLKQRSNALYFQDQLNLVDGQLQITAAGRIQSFNLNTPTIGDPFHPYATVAALEPPTAYTGDGAIAYFVRSTGTKIRSHVGNSFRAPSGYERYGGYYFSGFYGYNGDPTLRPERALAIDGGIDQNILGSRIQLSATWFYTGLQEVIRYVSILPPGDPFNRFDGYVNGGGGIARGAEFSARFAASPQTHIDTSYTYTNSDSKTPTIPGTSYFQTLGVSPHKFTLGVTQLVGPVTIAYDMTALSGYSQTLFGGGTRQFMFNGPVTADVVVRYSPSSRWPGEVYAKINNLFNQRPFENGFIGPKLWVIGGVRRRF